MANRAGRLDRVQYGYHQGPGRCIGCRRPILYGERCEGCKRQLRARKRRKLHR